MLISHYTYYFCYASMLFAFIASLFRYQKLDTALKVISILSGAAFINECVAFYLARHYGNNMPLYSIFSIVELCLISVFFNYSIDVFRKNGIGIIIAVIGIILGIANIVYLQPLNVLNNYFLFFEGILIISMALFSFARLMILDSILPMYLNPHFWIATILTFFWSVTFLNWGLYDYIIAKYASSIWMVNLSILIVNIITYSSIATVFILYPKMRVPE